MQTDVADALTFEFTETERPPLLALLGRTIVLNEIIALPVALAMSAVAGGFPRNLLVASLYSQTIGLTCALVAWSTFWPLTRLQPRRRHTIFIAQFFVCGVAGAEIARRVAPLLIDRRFDSGPVIVSWAVGATIALIVGIILITIRRLRAQVLATELEALQARINPHFLFNTLNSIASLIREDPQRAESMTLQLSSLFRYTLQAPRRGLVTIDEELTIVEGYLAIEQERLGDRLRYRIDVDPALRQVRVPPLILQPLVENAVKHGIAPSRTGGEVIVSGTREATRMQIVVSDTGSGGGSEAGTGEGLESVRRRLRATFGRHASLTLEQTGARTDAHLSVPLEERR